jgi:hypothetical protein
METVMSARVSMQLSVVRRAEASRPVLRIVEPPARESEPARSTSDDAPRHSFGLFALRPAPELGLLPALAIAAGAATAIGYLAQLGLERWTLMLCM